MKKLLIAFSLSSTLLILTASYTLFDHPLLSNWCIAGAVLCFCAALYIASLGSRADSKARIRANTNRATNARPGVRLRVTNAELDRTIYEIISAGLQYSSERKDDDTYIITIERPYVSEVHGRSWGKTFERDKFLATKSLRVATMYGTAKPLKVMGVPNTDHTGTIKAWRKSMDKLGPFTQQVHDEFITVKNYTPENWPADAPAYDSAEGWEYEKAMKLQQLKDAVAKNRGL